MSVVQVLVAAKGADAVAITALGALRSLLGFGETLQSLERRRVFEISGGGEEAPLVRELESYLQRTFEFWNPNKERCWIRTESQTLEVVPGQAPRAAETAGEGDDHLLLWTRPEDSLGDTDPAPAASEGVPRDFPGALGAAPSIARRGEVYSFRWSDRPDDAERLSRVDRAGAVRNRGEGLLVQPQYQVSRICLGHLPWPAWEAGNER